MSHTREGVFGTNNNLGIDFSNAPITVRLYYEKYQEDKKLLLNDQNECKKRFEDFLNSEETKKIMTFSENKKELTYDDSVFFSNYLTKLKGIQSLIGHSHPQYFKELYNLAHDYYCKDDGLKSTRLSDLIRNLSVGPEAILRNHANLENQLFQDFMSNVKSELKESKSKPEPVQSYNPCVLL